MGKPRPREEKQASRGPAPPSIPLFQQPDHTQTCSSLCSHVVSGLLSSLLKRWLPLGITLTIKYLSTYCMLGTAVSAGITDSVSFGSNQVPAGPLQTTLPCRSPGKCSAVNDSSRSPPVPFSDSPQTYTELVIFSTEFFPNRQQVFMMASKTVNKWMFGVSPRPHQVCELLVWVGNVSYMFLYSQFLVGMPSL